jgi:hypothetical protein
VTRGILDDYMGKEDPLDGTDVVRVRVRIEHKTAKALQVSQDGGQTVVWLPISAVSHAEPSIYGPGDTVTLEIPERTAEQKELL